MFHDILVFLMSVYIFIHLLQLSSQWWFWRDTRVLITKIIFFQWSYSCNTLLYPYQFFLCFKYIQE